MTFAQQLHKIQTQAGFIAALDQSGGSTPGALLLYGIDQGDYRTDAEMFSLIHEMRTRIVTSPSFGGARILGAILFEDTMNREIEGMPTPRYLWEEKQIVPFLKVDKGHAGEHEGVQLMKPIPDLDSTLDRAKQNEVFGTKMRSVIRLADPAGVRAIVNQQFEVALPILAAGLVPIIEPEVDIHCSDKAEAETLLKAELLDHLSGLGSQEQVILKLTIPDVVGFYGDCIRHPNVLRVVALSGGYARSVANALLARNPGLIASFSRALFEGLTADQSDDEFDSALDESIEGIFQASRT